MSSIPLPILLVIIVSVTVILLQLGIRRLYKQRKKYIESVNQTDPIHTSTPFNRPVNNFHHRAKKGLKNRFSIFNRVITTLIVLTISTLILLPFIDRMPQTLISIFVASAAIIIGIAAKPFIENFLSGIMITFSKKLNIGDTVLLENHYGTIEDITSTHMVIKLWDWRRLIIPNGAMLSQNLINYSLFDKWHWAHVEFHVSPKEDLALIRDIAKKVASESTYSYGVEEPSFWVMDTSKASITCWIAAWADSPSNSWELRNEIRTNLMIQFRKKEIDTHINFQKLNTEALKSANEMSEQSI